MKPPRSLLKEYPNIKRCVDARKPISVKVTIRDAKDTNNIMSLSTCAMAKAMCREWNADYAIIGLTSSYLLKGNTAIRFATPISVQREIVSFDRGSGFKPGVYHLAPIPKSKRRATVKKDKIKSKKSVIEGTSYSPKRVVPHETLSVRSMVRNKWTED